MSSFKVKKTKKINGKEIPKSKEELDKETCNGKKWWYYSVRYKNALGETKRKRSKQFATKKEADEDERIFLLSVSANNDNNSESITLDDLFTEYEEEISNQKNKDSSSYSDYLNYNNHISPILGSMKISDITILSIREFHHKINKKKYKRGNKEFYYGYDFKCKIHSLLSCILGYATSMGYITENVAKRYGNFQNKNDEVVEDEKIKYQTPEEFNLFISIVDDTMWKTLFAFFYWNGCRKGELQALTWNDIDFKHNTISFRKNLSTKIKGGGYKITNTKNRKNRKIALLPQLKPFLEELYRDETKYTNFDKKWFIFGGIRYTASSTIDKKFIQYYDILENQLNKKVNRLTSHQFGRHSHASLLISLGVRIEVIAERLGDTPEVIRKTYAHLFPSYNDEILEAIKEDKVKALSKKMEKYK